MHRFLPPHLFLLCVVASVVAGLALPLIGPAPTPLRFVGLPVLVVGLAVTVRSAGLFDRLRTNIKTFDDPDVLVVTGAFRFSRNPMYVGFTAALLGTAVLVGSVTALLGPVVFWLVADRWYIPFEEQRMVATFGQRYDDYRASVPRWIGPRRRVPVSVS